MPRRPAVLLLALVLPWIVYAQADESRLQITVRDGHGQPLPDVRVTVSLDDRTSTPVATDSTNPLGEAVIGVRPRRYYVVTASRDGYTPSSRRTDAPAGEVALPFTLNQIELLQDMPPRGTPVPLGLIYGSVVAPAGEPFAGVHVAATDEHGSIQASAVTGDNGAFRLSVPQGSYTVTSDMMVTPPPGSTARTFIGYGSSTYAPVPVLPGHRTGPVNLTPQPVVLLGITVTVVSEGGEPIRDAVVALASEPRSFSGASVSSMQGDRRTDANGVTRFAPELPGRMSISATGTLRSEILTGIAVLDLTDEPAHVTLVASPTARVSGRVDFEGRAAPLQGERGLRVMADMPGSIEKWPERNGSVDTAGNFTLTGLTGERCLRLVGLPPTWQVIEMTRGGQPFTDTPLSLSPGEQVTDVVIRVGQRDEPPRPHACRPR